MHSIESVEKFAQNMTQRHRRLPTDSEILEFWHAKCRRNIPAADMQKNTGRRYEDPSLAQYDNRADGQAAANRAILSAPSKRTLERVQLSAKLSQQESVDVSLRFLAFKK